MLVLRFPYKNKLIHVKILHVKSRPAFQIKGDTNERRRMLKMKRPAGYQRWREAFQGGFGMNIYTYSRRAGGHRDRSERISKNHHQDSE